MKTEPPSQPIAATDRPFQFPAERQFAVPAIRSETVELGELMSGQKKIFPILETSTAASCACKNFLRLLACVRAS